MFSTTSEGESSRKKGLPMNGGALGEILTGGGEKSGTKGAKSG